MSENVLCKKLGKELPALARAPYPGEKGQRILENISQEAWQLWLKHQTMLINEYRLTPIEPKDRSFLEEEMEKFLFTGGAEAPPDYVQNKPDSSV